jgi:NADPH:quinone reductase-like Zn-dependent oxidoreductase
MRALVSPAYGPLESMRIVDLPLPEPGPGQVRIRVQASALNPADFKSVTGEMKILHAGVFPMIVGFDFSGVVDVLGKNVSGLKQGDEVFGHLPYSRGTRFGTFAEYTLANATALAKKPAGISHTIAASSATAGLTALQSLRDIGKLASGGRVLVIGASGGVGSMAVGIAHKLGVRVTAICGTHAVDFVKELGADEVIDRLKVSPLQTVRGPFNVVFDTAAAFSWKTSRHLIGKGGTYVTTLPTMTFFRDMLLSIVTPTRARFIIVKPRAKDLDLLGIWFKQGLKVPIFQIVKVKDVAAGLKRLQAGAVHGRIAVDVAGGWD